MRRLRGLYIEDEKDNIEIYSALFELQGLELESIYPLPSDLEAYYNIVLEKDIDFLIIDNHLEKQVRYSGIDVLREIRQHDSTIYAVLLTNRPLEQFEEQFGDYDYELNKSQLQKKCSDIVEKIKRACALREENDLSKCLENESEKENETIQLLKKISSQLDKVE